MVQFLCLTSKAEDQHYSVSKNTLDFWT